LKLHGASEFLLGIPQSVKAKRLIDGLQIASVWVLLTMPRFLPVCCLKLEPVRKQSSESAVKEARLGVARKGNAGESVSTLAKSHVGKNLRTTGRSIPKDFIKSERWMLVRISSGAVILSTELMADLCPRRA
jgi:hypothetical protein